MTDSSLEQGVGATPARRAALHQFLRFCTVGASSTLITFAIFTLLIKGVHLDQSLHGALAAWPSVQDFVQRHRLHVQLAAFIGFLFGVTNGFIWNSRWTFPQNDATRRHAQKKQFLLVNVVGLILNQIILYTVNALLTAGRPERERGWEPLVAFAIATGLVLFWNFFANKHWTFKTRY